MPLYLHNIQWTEKRQVSMTMKCHNHRPQIRLWQYAVCTLDIDKQRHTHGSKNKIKKKQPVISVAAR